MGFWNQQPDSVDFKRRRKSLWLSGERMGSRQAQTLSVGVHKLEVQFGSRIVSDIAPKEV